jgi:hypothetical protein
MFPRYDSHFYHENKYPVSEIVTDGSTVVVKDLSFKYLYPGFGVLNRHHQCSQNCIFLRVIFSFIMMAV